MLQVIKAGFQKFVNWIPSIVKENAKRYLISSIVTFVASFLFVFAVTIKEMDLSTISLSVFCGIAGVALRVAIKALAEYILSILASQKDKKETPPEAPKQ
jgi:Flp pilus assembly protein protease CpaA